MKENLLKNFVEWDLSSKKDEYPAEIKKIYYENHIKLRKKYTNWIGKISIPFAQDLDWWSAIPASRNPHYSEIFNTICILETIKKLRKKNIQIKTHSKELYKLIKLHFKKNIQITLKNNKKKLSNTMYIFQSIIFQTIIFIIINLLYKKNIPRTNKMILINNYPNNNLDKVDRLFQFNKKFLKINRNKIFFIPTILINKNIIKIWRTINFLYKKNYFFKESTLHFKDLFYAFSYPTRLKKFNIKFKKFNQFDLSRLIYKELNDFKCFHSTIIGILNYRFFKRLSCKNLSIKKTFCWHENMELRGWNYGVRKFFPFTQTFGYQGFTNLPRLMNTIPTEFEEKYKLIPKIIIVSGRAYVKARKEFYPKLKIKVGPSLILSDVHKSYKKNKKIKFLVILNEFIELNLSILDWLEYAVQKNKDLLFYVKKPKILKIDKLIDNKNLKNNIIFCEGNLPIFLKQAEHVVSCCATSSVIEALGYNCKIIIPQIDPNDPYSLTSIKVPKKMFKFFKNKNKFLEYLNDQNSQKKTNKVNFHKYRNYFFEKLSIKKENMFI